MTISTKGKANEDSLKSLGKVVAILDCFSTIDQSLSLTEICERLDYPRSTTHRLLVAMRDARLLDQEKARGNYRLGLRLFQYGNIVLANLELRRVAAPIVDSLQETANLTVHLAVFDGLSAIVIKSSDPEGDMNVADTLIENAPSHCTGVGKVILAFQSEDVVKRVIDSGLEKFTDRTLTDETSLKNNLKTIRKRGYAIDDNEHQPGRLCIAAPIHDENGNVFAAISISGPEWKMPKEKIDDLSKIATHHAQHIENRLGYNKQSKQD